MSKKGSYFVKRQLDRLRQEDDFRDAGFFLVPQKDFWMGSVVN
jgi:hypothetical protein